MELHPEIFISVSATTRPPRPSEIDGVHYHFVSDEQFDALIAADALLEWAVVHGTHRYGTLRAPVLRRLLPGVRLCWKSIYRGRGRSKRACPRPDSSSGATFLGRAGPSACRARHRIAAQRERRLETARAEMAAQAEFDDVVVNSEIDQAVEDLVALVRL
jgi:guanylate kinase